MAGLKIFLLKFSGGSLVGTVELQHSYFHFIISITFNIMIPISFFLILVQVQHTILKLKKVSTTTS